MLTRFEAPAFDDQPLEPLPDGGLNGSTPAINPLEHLRLIEAIVHKTSTFPEPIATNFRKRMALAHEYGSVDYPDLRQAAYFGLVKAVQKFDPEKSGSFSTYASWHILGAANREIPKQLSIGYPENKWETLLRRPDFMNRFASAVPHTVPNEEVPDTESYADADEYERYTETLPVEDMALVPEHDSLDYLANDSFETVEANAVVQHLCDQASLTRTEKRIIELRTGLHDAPLTFAAISEQLIIHGRHVTPARIRQIEQAAHIKIRKVLEASGVMSN